MKVKTSITLSKETLALLDRHVAGEASRSYFIELAVRTYLELLERNERDQKNLEIIDRLSDKLDEEASDVLRYQSEARV